jgi:hypothetical protein
MHRYNPDERKWTKIACMAHARSHLAGVTLNESVYALGGYAEGKVFDCVEKYDGMYVYMYVHLYVCVCVCALGLCRGEGFRLCREI